MPQGKPESVPDDGLTTRQRRNRPLLVVHTGPGKGKSTAAFGMALRAWNQGWPIGVFQFVKSAEVAGRRGDAPLRGRCGETGEGGPVAWHKMGEGWSWIQRPGTEDDHAADAARGLGADQARPGRRDVPLLRAGRVHLPDEVGLGRRRRRRRDPAPTGPATSTSSSPAGTRTRTARRGRRPGHRDDARSSTRWTPGRRASRASSGDVPRLVVAAPASGQRQDDRGDRADRRAAPRAGLTVSPHKVGPDYIDPGYHALAAGRPGPQPRPVAGRRGAGRAAVPARRRAAPTSPWSRASWACSTARTGAAASFASTAHVARLLDAPVVLVVDARRAEPVGRRARARLRARSTRGPDRRGRSSTGSAPTGTRRSAARRCAEVGVPVLGVLRRHDDVATPVPAPRPGPGGRAAGRGRARRWRALGALVADAGVDLRRASLAARPRPPPPLPRAPWDPGRRAASPSRGPAGGRGRRAGPAFTFGYAETRRAAAPPPGAEVSQCSTRCATRRCRRARGGLVIGGGFPEVYAAELSANAPLRREVAALAAAAPGRGRVRRAALPGRELDGRADVRRASTSTPR